jgi:hypothetical protein
VAKAPTSSALVSRVLRVPEPRIIERLGGRDQPSDADQPGSDYDRHDEKHWAEGTAPVVLVPACHQASSLDGMSTPGRASPFLLGRSSSSVGQRSVNSLKRSRRPTTFTAKALRSASKVSYAYWLWSSGSAVMNDAPTKGEGRVRRRGPSPQHGLISSDPVVPFLDASEKVRSHPRQAAE